MILRLALTAAVLAACTLPSCAADPAMVRVVSCQGPDAAMEIYLPEMLVYGSIQQPPQIDGWYLLDLSAARKGKHLEPVHISASPDKKFLIIDQYTRSLPPTKIPTAGGIVNFDNRFGTHATCAPFSTQ